MTLTSISSPLHLLSSNNEQYGDTPPLTSSYHEPPSNADYSTNPSVFGQILNGNLPCRTYNESTNLLAFRDKSPRAKFHALVIPKRYIKNISTLTSSDVELLKEMRAMGLNLLQTHQPEAYATQDFTMCYHIPPFNSVDHLHLHILAPVSEMNYLYKIKYWCGTRWCASEEVVVQRLEEGLSAVPFGW